jgi:hypothetical protein
MNDSIISDYMKKIGARGGNSTASKLTAKQRSDIARKAAKARWKKARRSK